MNNICLSAAPILRCQSLSRTEQIALFVPAAAELLLVLPLLPCFNQPIAPGSVLLVLQSLSFFLLAIADLLAHVLPATRASLATFKVVDLITAIASFLPLLCYAAFVLRYTKRHLLDLVALPRLTLAALAALVPPILALNAVASVLGVSYNRTFFAIVVANPTTNLVLADVALGLLTAFQAAVFLLAAFHIGYTLFSSSDDTITLVGGLAYVAAGLKLGVIESIIGFATGTGFAGALARRILHFSSRACLVIGVLKGMAIVEDLSEFEYDIERHRLARSGLRRLSGGLRPLSIISGPRNSTFQPISPAERSFPFSRARRTRAMPEPEPAMRNPHDRVTVHYDGRTPPVLQLRFSGLDVPNANVLFDAVRQRDRGLSGSSDSVSRPSSKAAEARSLHAQRSHGELDPAPQQTARAPPPAHRPTFSRNSLDVVREIASKFPGLPPRRHRVTLSSLAGLPEEENDYGYAFERGPEDAAWAASTVRRHRSLRRGPSSAFSSSPGSSLRRKPVPRVASPSSQAPNAPPPSEDMRTITRTLTETPPLTYGARSPTSGTGSSLPVSPRAGLLARALARQSQMLGTAQGWGQDDRLPSASVEESDDASSLGEVQRATRGRILAAPAHAREGASNYYVADKGQNAVAVSEGYESDPDADDDDGHTPRSRSLLSQPDPLMALVRDRAIASALGPSPSPDLARSFRGTEYPFPSNLPHAFPPSPAEDEDPGSLKRVRTARTPRAEEVSSFGHVRESMAPETSSEVEVGTWEGTVLGESDLDEDDVLAQEDASGWRVSEPYRHKSAADSGVLSEEERDWVAQGHGLAR